MMTKSTSLVVDGISIDFIRMLLPILPCLQTYLILLSLFNISTDMKEGFANPDSKDT